MAQCVLRQKSGGELILLKSGTLNDMIHTDITLNKDFDGLLLCSSFRQGSGGLYCYAKQVSGTFDMFQRIDTRNGVYSTARGGCSVYKIKCKAGSVVQIYSTNNKDQIEPNQETTCFYYLFTQK